LCLVIFGRWRVWLTPPELQVAAGALPFDVSWLADWGDWLAREGLLAGTPFLISPAAEYDVVLNDFFRDARMITSARRTQEGYARDLAAFLNFLWLARDQRSWRDAGEADHLAYSALAAA